MEKQIKNQSHVDGFFLTAMELCTTNSQLSVTLSKQLSTWRFWSVWETVCVACDRNCGRGDNGFSTTTMPRALCINRVWVFGARFYYRPRTSPSLAEFSPLWFFFFPKCKMMLRGRHFGDVTTIKIDMTSLLKGLREEEFLGCFQQRKRRWDKCIVSNEKYFEGDHIDVS